MDADPLLRSQCALNMDAAVQRPLELPKQLSDLRPMVQWAAEEACSLLQTKSPDAVTAAPGLLPGGFLALLSELLERMAAESFLPVVETLLSSLPGEVRG